MRTHSGSFQRKLCGQTGMDAGGDEIEGDYRESQNKPSTKASRWFCREGLVARWTPCSNSDAVNKTWGFRYRTQFSLPGAPQQASVSREFSFKVLGTETINTPAGPFGTFKIEETSYEVERRGGSYQTLDETLTVRHLWYAPEAKFIVKIAEVRAAKYYISEQEPDYELIAFDLK